jgi:hypothetical protein
MTVFVLAFVLVARCPLVFLTAREHSLSAPLWALKEVR